MAFPVSDSGTPIDRAFRDHQPPVTTYAQSRVEFYWPCRSRLRQSMERFRTRFPPTLGDPFCGGNRSMAR